MSKIIISLLSLFAFSNVNATVIDMFNCELTLKKLNSHESTEQIISFSIPRTTIEKNDDGLTITNGFSAGDVQLNMLNGHLWGAFTLDYETNGEAGDWLTGAENILNLDVELGSKDGRSD